MRGKIIKLSIFLSLLIAWWKLLVCHYYNVLCDWAAKKLWRTQPFMYASIEWWLLFSLLVCTYLVVKIVDTLI